MKKTIVIVGGGFAGLKFIRKHITQMIQSTQSNKGLYK